MSGPLEGIRIVELAGIGPGPYACMLLADAGADIIRIDRPPAVPPSGSQTGPYWDILNRSRKSVSIDLKHAEGINLVLDLVAGADALIEGFRPGVADRLGLGPDACFERNERLVYGRMTGWGQDGPIAQSAGHDIDYIALAGALWAIGRDGEAPVPPLNLVGDFGGGGMMLAFGVCAALLDAKRSGHGQVVDAAMVDGAASLMTMTFAFKELGLWDDGRSSNPLDSAAPFYEVYETADGKWFAVGAIEPQFYATLIQLLGIDAGDLPPQNDRTQWPETKKRFAAIFKEKTRREWDAIFAGTDGCGAPVLSPWEAHEHEHNRARGTFVEVDGITQPGPVPRFSRTPAAVSKPPSRPGADTDTALAEWGIPSDRLVTLRQHGAIS
ncbi:MAG: CaiB/BaiF CoA-transferase family protein [Acidimicrobiales bacterium]